MSDPDSENMNNNSGTSPSSDPSPEQKPPTPAGSGSASTNECSPVRADNPEAETEQFHKQSHEVDETAPDDRADGAKESPTLPETNAGKKADETTGSLAQGDTGDHGGPPFVFGGGASQFARGLGATSTPKNPSGHSLLRFANRNPQGIQPNNGQLGLELPPDDSQTHLALQSSPETEGKWGAGGSPSPMQTTPEISSATSLSAGAPKPGGGHGDPASLKEFVTSPGYSGIETPADMATPNPQTRQQGNSGATGGHRDPNVFNISPRLEKSEPRGSSSTDFPTSTNPVPKDSEGGSRGSNVHDQSSTPTSSKGTRDRKHRLGSRALRSASQASGPTTVVGNPRMATRTPKNPDLPANNRKASSSSATGVSTPQNNCEDSETFESPKPSPADSGVGDSPGSADVTKFPSPQSSRGASWEQENSLAAVNGSRDGSVNISMNMVQSMLEAALHQQNQQHLRQEVQEVKQHLLQQQQLQAEQQHVATQREKAHWEEVGSLNQQLRSKDEVIAQLTEEQDRLVQTARDLEYKGTKWDEQDGVIGALSLEKQQLQDNFEAVSTKMQKMDVHICGLMDTNARHCHQLKDKELLERSYQEVQREVEESQRICAEQQANLKDASEQVQESKTTLAKDKDQHEHEVLRLTVQMQELSSELAQLRMTSHAQISRLTEDRDAAVADRDRLNISVEELTETKRQLEEHMTELKRDAEAMRSKLQMMDDHIRGLMDTITRHTSQLGDKDELERSYQDVQVKLEKLERVCAEQQANLRDALDRVQETDTTLAKERNDHELEVMRLRVQTLELSRELDQLKVTSQADISHLTENLDAVSADCDRLNISVEELTETKRQLEEHMTELKCCLARSEKDKDEVTTLCRVLKTQKKTAEEQSVMFGNQTTTLQMQAAQLHKMYVEKERELQDSDTANRQRIEEITAHMRKREEQVVPLEVEAQRATLESGNLRHQLQEMQADKRNMEITINALKDEVERCASRVWECQRKEEELRREISDKEAQKLRYLKETQLARSQVKLLRDEIKRLRLRFD